MQDLLDDVSSVGNTLAAIGGTTKVLGRKARPLSAALFNTGRFGRR